MFRLPCPFCFESGMWSMLVCFQISQCWKTRSLLADYCTNLGSINNLASRVTPLVIFALRLYKQWFLQKDIWKKKNWKAIVFIKLSFFKKEGNINRTAWSLQVTLCTTLFECVGCWVFYWLCFSKKHIYCICQSSLPWDYETKTKTKKVL